MKLGRKIINSGTDEETNLIIEPYIDLNETDVDELRKKILEDGGIPSKLKEIVKETFS